jgi:hypothetical protein
MRVGRTAGERNEQYTNEDRDNAMHA